MKGRAQRPLCARRAAQAERAGQERTVAAEVMQAEIAALRDSLGQRREEALQARSRDAGDASELVTLRGTLAQIEGEARERTATTAALQAEIATLRGRLAQAEGEARERAATTAALQAEIATLQDTLTAAREVGKAAIAAFRINTAAPIKSEVPGGWRKAIARFFSAETTF